jgi:hypothetical protein
MMVKVRRKDRKRERESHFERVVAQFSEEMFSTQIFH